jgi:TrmH family RNA methyltransferase
MITSTANSRVKRVVKLQTQAKAREEERAFVIEGAKLFLEAPEHLIQEVYITQDYLCKVDINPQIAEKLAALPYETVSEEVMRKMSDTKTPQGILCVLAQIEEERRFGRTAAPLFLLLEDIQDPGNLGTIIRTAEATGAIVQMSHGCADIYNPKTVRATMGSLFRIPFRYVDDLDMQMIGFKRDGAKIFAACLEGGEDYRSQDYRGATAFLLGNESAGVSRAKRDAATDKITIPMCGQVESLNVATAAAILLYEAVRQREVTP